MGQILHGSARTTEAVRRAIQNSQESLRTLSEHYGINQKTVAVVSDISVLGLGKMGSAMASALLASGAIRYRVESVTRKSAAIH